MAGWEDPCGLGWYGVGEAKVRHLNYKWKQDSSLSLELPGRNPARPLEDTKQQMDGPKPWSSQRPPKPKQSHTKPEVLPGSRQIAC